MEYVKIIVQTLQLEAEAILKAADKITQDHSTKLLEIYRNLAHSGGSLIFCGVGKSGHVGVKLAATFSSLGLPSFFLHPTEALHGDLGRVSSKDVLCMISKSGTTEEILKLLPFIDIKKENRIALVGDLNSQIANSSGLVFDCSVEKEACLNNQAPTTSSTLAMSIGDAMAVAFEKFSGLSKEAFAINHPGGLLGKSIRLKVKDIMTIKENCAVVSPKATFEDVLMQMTQKNVGGCAVINESKFLGIIVEGDIRRAFSKKVSINNLLAEEIMTKNPVWIGPEEQALKALELMEKRQSQIYILPVLIQEQFLGFIRLHDIAKQGL